MLILLMVGEIMHLLVMQALVIVMLICQPHYLLAIQLGWVVGV